MRYIELFDRYIIRATGFIQTVQQPPATSSAVRGLPVPLRFIQGILAPCRFANALP